VIILEPTDQVKKTGKDGSIFVTIGHYALSNSKNTSVIPNFTIFGLGSCIALILFDELNRVSAMSHILLPRVFSNKKILFPHKYASLSVKLLLEELLNHGAVRENIKAFFIGGSKIFNIENNLMGNENTISVRAELNALKIHIIVEDTGGLKGRNVIFDPKSFSLYVKSTGGIDYKKLY